MSETAEKKRPSRKPKASTPAIDDDVKKRTKKPRPGKIVTIQNLQSSAESPVNNVILHLKCSLQDLNEYNNRFSKLLTNPLEYNPDIPPEVSTYDTAKHTFASFDDPSSEQPETEEDVAKWNSVGTNAVIAPLHKICHVCQCEQSASTGDEEVGEKHAKELNQKLKQLKIQLYKNALQSDKKAACFWCTYDYDNTPCYIPKYEMDGTIYGYGSFCRPECAVAFLMKEHIDDSTKFERYHLLNHIYSKVYNCKKNIKPAPNPYYLLDKFYGTLSIQEYRKLLKTEHLMLVVDKPLTRILPELHEDTDEMLLNIYGISKTNVNTSGVYKVKRQSEKPSGPSKTSIIRNKFGLV
jgi:hypothetical protein